MENDFEKIGKKARVQGHLAMLGANVVWGLMSPLSKELLNEGVISPIGLTGMRIMGGACLFWLFSLVMPSSIVKNEKIDKSDRWKIVVASLLMIASNQGLYIMGIGFTSPIDSAVVSSMTPIFTMILAALFISERITPLKMLGVVVGLSGALMIVLKGKADMATHATNPLLGNSMCMVAQICAAVYYVAFRPLIGKYSPFTLMKWMFLVSAVVVSPFTVGDIMQADWSKMPLWCIADIAYVVVFATFVSYLLIPFSQRRIKPTIIAMYNYLQPVVSAFYSVFAGLAILTGMKVVATMLIFGGVWIVTQSRNSQTWESLFKRKMSLK